MDYDRILWRAIEEGMCYDTDIYCEADMKNICDKYPIFKECSKEYHIYHGIRWASHKKLLIKRWFEKKIEHIIHESLSLTDSII